MKRLYDEIKEKYNYDDKTISVLKKIVPNIISYYGREYENIINDALKSCEIIVCSSYDTMSSILSKYNLNQINDDPYYSVPQITYNEQLNRFEITDIKRLIILENKYNLDSPKGVEVLTYALISLIKSYLNEYVVEGNTLIKTEGLRKEYYKVVCDMKNLYTEFLEEEGYGLQKSLNIYDTYRVVSEILKTEYKIYDYSYLQIIGLMLKEKFDLGYEIKDEEILHNKSFSYRIGINRLKEVSDKCFFKEDEMLSETESKSKKNNIEKWLKNYIKNDVSNALIDIRLKNEIKKS